MRIWPTLLTAMLLAGPRTFAADPATIEELKTHFASVEDDDGAFTADYEMMMDMAAAGQPQATGMGEMTMSGNFIAKGNDMLMNMEMNMEALGQNVNMKMLMKDNTMLMLMDMGVMVQAMKYDMSVMTEMADKMGVPEAALNSGNMGMSVMKNPAKMLELYEEMYTLKLDGKEILDDEEVYLVTAVMKADILENFMKSPLLEPQMDMYKSGIKLYLGADDGIMRKMDMGFMIMTMTNIDLEAKVTDDDLTLEIPEGTQVMDLTEMMKAQFENMIPE